MACSSTASVHLTMRIKPALALPTLHQRVFFRQLLLAPLGLLQPQPQPGRHAVLLRLRLSLRFSIRFRLAGRGLLIACFRPKVSFVRLSRVEIPAFRIRTVLLTRPPWRWPDPWPRTNRCGQIISVS